MSIEVYLTFVLACVVVMIVPGPAVTLIVANSLRHGRRAGLLNVAGIQLGLAVMVGVVLFGLVSLVAAMGEWFFWIRLAGAAYLIWLGWKLICASGEIVRGEAAVRTRDPLLGYRCLLLAAPAHGQEWPSRPVSIVVAAAGELR